jgi:hypothetical protein
LLGRIARLARNDDREGLAGLIDETLARAEQQDDALDEGGDAEDDAAADLDADLGAGATPDLSSDAALDAIAEREGLPRFSSPGTLDATDIAVHYAGRDEEACEFFVANAVGKLWRHYLRDEDAFDLDALINHPAGEYGSRVRERFLEQLEGARSLPIPAGYKGPYKPNLMQRLIAYRLLTERRIGNWAGTGAGKTLGAILASQVVGARLTVVVGLNSTIEEDDAKDDAQKKDDQHGWAAEIRQAFPQRGPHHQEQRPAPDRSRGADVRPAQL